MTGSASGLQSNLVPLSHRVGAFVPVSLPEVSREKWDEFIALEYLASAILKKNRAAVAEAACEVAAIQGEGEDGLSAFMSDLNGSAEQLVIIAAMMKSAGARLALVSGREQEWASLQDDRRHDISA